MKGDLDKMFATSGLLIQHALLTSSRHRSLCKSIMCCDGCSVSFIRVLAGSLDFFPLLILGNQCFILSFQRTQLPSVEDFCFPKKCRKTVMD